MKKIETAALAHVPRTTSGALDAHRGEADPSVIYIAKLASSGRPAMRSALNKIADMVLRGSDMHTLRWGMLRYQHTQAIRARLVEAYAARSANRMIAALKGVMKAAWGLGQIPTDEYHKAVAIKAIALTSLPPAGRVLELSEIETLFEVCEDRGDAIGARDAALITVLYAGGLRREEASALDVRHFTPKDGALQVTGKGAKVRTAYIRKQHAQYLEAWHGMRDADDAPMFVGFDARAPKSNPTRRLSKTGVSHAIRALARDAKLKPFTPHDLRRSFATHLLDADADILMVQKLMGHASLQTTSIYDRRGEIGKKKAIEKLPEIRFPTKK